MFGSYAKGQLLQHLTAEATVYGVILIGSRLGAFFLLPFYLAFLTPEDFGVIGIVLIAQGALVPLFGLGLHDAVQRYYHGWLENERPERLGEIWICVFIWSFLLCGALTAGHKIFDLLFKQVGSMPYFVLGLWTAFFTTLIVVCLSVLRIRGELKYFAYASFGMFVTQSAISLFLVGVMLMGAVGYLLGGLFSSAIWAVILCIQFWRDASPSWSMQKLREILSYSLPLIPTTILDGTIGMFDRYFLDHYVPLSSIGFYNLANQFGSVVVAANQSIKSAWFPFVYRIMQDRKDTATIISQFSFYYVAVLLPPSLLVALLSREVIEVFGERYLESYRFIPWFVLAVYLQAVTSALGRGLDLAKKNIHWPIISCVHVTASLSALGYLVPAYGAMGAAWSIVISAAVRAAFQIVLAHRVYPRPFNGIRLLMLWSSGLGMFWLGSCVTGDSLSLNVALKLTVVIAGTIATAVLLLERSSLLLLRSWLSRKLMRETDCTTR